MRVRNIIVQSTISLLPDSIIVQSTIVRVRNIIVQSTISLLPDSINNSTPDQSK